ncbi:MAG: prephenate dehydratase [Acidobacteria bacterium]|nr:MAG: prephenate dehydratase [Acidobacteriota bacterium]
MKLKNVREQIDLIDSKILQLLTSRMEQVVIARKLKKEIFDPKREKQILEKLKDSTNILLRADFLEQIYETMFTESKRNQERGLKLIAFQGEHGAYSEVAAHSWNADLATIACERFSNVFEGVQRGIYDLGIVPVENTLGGVVGEVNDLMIHTDLHIVGAIEIPIEHCLLALESANEKTIRKVYSHSQALTQCRHFINKRDYEPVAYFDTAGSARMLMERGTKSMAAIASRWAGDLYHLNVLQEGIEDFETNRTRFLILSKQKIDTDGQKCSIIFSTENKAGSLYSVLQMFASRKVNLTRIESIPNQFGKYVFFLDFEGSEKDDHVQAILGHLEETTRDFRLIGCYNESKTHSG